MVGRIGNPSDTHLSASGTTRLPPRYRSPRRVAACPYNQYRWSTRRSDHARPQRRAWVRSSRFYRPRWVRLWHSARRPPQRWDWQPTTDNGPLTTDQWWVRLSRFSRATVGSFVADCRLGARAIFENEPTSGLFIHCRSGAHLNLNLRLLCPELLERASPPKTNGAVGPISDSAALWITCRAALPCLLRSAWMRPFISRSCSREDDHLMGSARVSCSQGVDETVYLSVLFSRRRSLMGSAPASCSQGVDVTVSLSCLVLEKTIDWPVRVSFELGERSERM